MRVTIQTISVPTMNATGIHVPDRRNLRPDGATPGGGVSSPIAGGPA
jgi:hypothetical protein